MLAVLPNQKMIERTTLMITRRCNNCLLNWKEFNHVDLSRTDLKNTNFKGSKFVDVDFSEADLRGAEFEEAYFEAVSMRRTNLCGATMMDGQKSSIGCWEE